jgi:hypothetical protein
VVFWATVVVAVLLLAGCGYCGAYLYLASPTVWISSGPGPWEVPVVYTGRWTHDQKFWEKAFAPAHWVDKQIRRDTWLVRRQ